MNIKDKLKKCVGCKNNFYNGNNEYGIERCWSLRDAKVVWRKEVDINQRPPWNQKSDRFLDCYRKVGYVYIDAKRNRYNK